MPTISEMPTVPRAPAPRRRSAPRVLAALGVAVLAVLGVAATYAVAVLDPTGRRLDDAVMTAAMNRGARWSDELGALLGVVTVPAVLLATAVLAGTALARGRGGRAVAVLVIVLGSQLVTQVLKAVLPRTGDVVANSLPSGHVTLVVALGVALLITLPAVLRPLAALVGAGAAAATGVATMVAGWHRPSDLVAAVGVVLATTALVAACARDRPEPIGGPGAASGR